MKNTYLFIVAFFLIFQNIRCQSDQKFLIDKSGIGNIKFGMKFQDLVHTYKVIEDLHFEGEDAINWIGKKLEISKNEWIVVESDWEDTTIIVRIATNSKKFKTISGYKVGDKVSQIISNKDRISYYEDVQGFEVISDKLNFGFSIEQPYTDDFYKKVEDCTDCSDFEKFINPNATITEIIVMDENKH